MKTLVSTPAWMTDTPVTKWLIYLNTSIWLVGLTGDLLRIPWLSTMGLLQRFAIFPEQIIAEGTLWTPFTYMFLHGGAVHLFMNMLGLYLLGPDLEKALGSRVYLTLYLLAGFVGGVFFFLVTYFLLGSLHPCVGASGAIMGLLGAISAIYPQRVYLILPLMIPIRAVTLAVILTSVHIFFILTPYGTGIAWDVHLFGGLAGYLFTLSLALRHRAHWKAQLATWDPESWIPEYEQLAQRKFLGEEPLSATEQARHDLLRDVLRYEDVLPPGELPASSPR